MLKLGYLITLKKDMISLLIAKRTSFPKSKPIKCGHCEVYEEKGNPSIVKEKKVPSNQKQNSTLSESKENSANIEEEVQVGGELLAFLISSIPHTSIASSSRLNL
jgi:hypothetical protein